MWLAPRGSPLQAAASDYVTIGRTEREFAVAARHRVLGTPIDGPVPAGFEAAVFGLGCFWGVEKLFWELAGVYSTSVGYAGGTAVYPAYEEVCAGMTGHAEAVRVVFDPARIGFRDLLTAFWESHDPTQGMRQGNDIGSQYRSIILTTSDDQHEAANASLTAYQRALTTSGRGRITTEVGPLDVYYFAEDFHQQFLAKHPNGYCPLHATGVKLPTTSVEEQGAVP